MLVTFALAWTTYRKHYNFVKWHESNVVFSHQGIEQFYSSMVAQKMGIVGVVLSTHRLFFFPKQQFLIYWLRREKKLVCPLHQIQWCWRHMPPLSYILILVNQPNYCVALFLVTCNMDMEKYLPFGYQWSLMRS